MLAGADRPTTPWRRPAFVRLWLGTTASALATWALPFVLGLALVEGELGGSELGLVLAVRTAGFLVSVPLAGVVADRRSRRSVVLAAGLAAAIASVLLATAYGRSEPSTLVAALVVGAGQGACRPAFQALTAEVVSADLRLRANAALSLGSRVSVLVAPLAAVALARATSPRTVVLALAALWAAAALVPPSGTAGSGPSTAGAGRHGLLRRLWGEWVEGVHEARRHPWFGAGLGALAAVIMTGYSATAVALPVVSRDRTGSDALLAWSATAYTVGAVVVALVLPRLRLAMEGWVALGALSAYGLVPLALAAGPSWSVVVAYLVAGAGIELFNVPWFTATQREVRPELLARVSSVDFLVSYGLAPLGLAFMAPAMAGLGADPVLLGCAVVCFVAPGLAALVPSSRRLSVRPAAAPGVGRG